MSTNKSCLDSISRHPNPPFINSAHINVCAATESFSAPLSLSFFLPLSVCV